jgi:hypothetical protein
MYHEESNTPAMARTSNLNEELGMVISFKVFCMNNICYISFFFRLNIFFLIRLVH